MRLRKFLTQAAFLAIWLGGRLIPWTKSLFEGYTEFIPKTEKIILNSESLGDKGKSVDFGFGVYFNPFGAVRL